MSPYKQRNRMSEDTAKLGVTPKKRRELVEAGLLSFGGRVKVDPIDNGKPIRDRAAFVRALLGR